MRAEERQPQAGRFVLKTIGPEPSGATPLEQEDLEGLIPDFVATRADLNQVEFENITRAIAPAQREARSLGPKGVLDYGFMLKLHRRMFEDVWRWAGTMRLRVTNIGVDPYSIASQARLALDDARFWHAEMVYEPDELAARIHGRLVSVHPFPNGNGRCTRLMADLYRTSIGIEPFVWGGAKLDSDGSGRARYIEALIYALKTDDYTDLVRFARGDQYRSRPMPSREPRRADG